MPEVNSVRVKFTRSKQPKDYESAIPEVEISAAIQPGDDHLAVTKRLMLDAATVVYATLGVAVPNPVVKKLGDGAAELDESEGTVETENLPAEPVKDSKPATKATKPADDDGLPDDDAKPAEKQQISTGEERVNPEDDDGLPDDDAKPATKAAESKKEEPAKDKVEVSNDDFEGLDDDDDSGSDEISAADLQKFVRAAVGAKKLSVPKMKEFLAGHNVARIEDTTAEQRVAIKAQVDAAIG